MKTTRDAVKIQAVEVNASATQLVITGRRLATTGSLAFLVRNFCTMCGRFTLRTPTPKLIELFQLNDLPTLSPRFNVAPTQQILIIRLSSLAEPGNAPVSRQAQMARWGLVPFWAKDLSIGNRMLNARSETVAEKPAFRQAFQKRRCLVPADGFYEWEPLAVKQKQPWLIHMPDQLPFAMAGLWESWKSPDNSDDLLISCTVLTTEANADMRPIHDRMPVILQPEQYDTWLSADSSLTQRSQLMRPLADGILQRFKVSTLVNKPSHDSTDCVRPLGE